MTEYKQLEKKLSRIGRVWLTGLLVSEAIWILGWAAIGIVLLCWWDVVFAPGEQARVLAGSSGTALGIVLLLWRSLVALRVDRRAIARYADRLGGSRRDVILTAYELGLAGGENGASSLHAYLLQLSCSRGIEAIDRIFSAWPKSTVRRATRWMLIRLAIALAAFLLNPVAVSTGGMRVLFPHKDLPPYSSYTFDIAAGPYRVVYGQDLVVECTIKGGVPRSRVEFVTRRGTAQQASSCFRAADGTYIQRLERVTRPVAFCYRLGKSRSKWHQVDVLLQPRIVETRVLVVPPAYSLLPKRVVKLGNEPLIVLRGADVELHLSSNRPLGSGALQGLPLDENEEPFMIAGEIEEKQGMVYRWRATCNARLSVTINDVLGTACLEPLSLLQEIRPDVVPRAVIETPAAYALSTASVDLPVSAFADDDLGLRKVELYRTLSGYHDRAMSIEFETGSREHRIETVIPLRSLGLVPGEVLEFYIEARDFNPALTGVGISAIARVKIISDGEYAEIIRARTTLEQFASPFAIISKEMEAYRNALESLSKALEAGTLSETEAAMRMAELAAQRKALKSMLQQVAESFAAFDVEQELQSAAGELAKALSQSEAHPGWNPDAPTAERQAALREALADLSGGSAPMKDVLMSAEDMIAVSRVMECAAQYRALVDRQEQLLRSLDNYEGRNRQTTDLTVLAENEDSIRTDLAAFRVELEAAAKGLPAEGYEDLSKSVNQFLTEMDRIDIPAPMVECSKAGRASQARESARYASTALDKMRELMSKPGDCMGGLCQGGLKFNVPASLSASMGQMLRALMTQYGTGVGYGAVGAAGIGTAGASEGGYMPGGMPRGIPVYGPMARNPLAAMGGAGESGEGGGGGSGEGDRVAVGVERQETPEASTRGKGSIEFGWVPRQYREAVKQFYAE